MISSAAFVIPEPTFVVCRRYLGVSVPHENDFELFSFHGNVNEEFQGVEAGQDSLGIERNEQINGYIRLEMLIWI